MINEDLINEVRFYLNDSENYMGIKEKILKVLDDLSQADPKISKYSLVIRACATICAIMGYDNSSYMRLLR